MHLFGSAKKAIEGIRIYEANYDVAINVLSDRFGRRDMLVDDHLHNLLAMAPIRSSADLDKLLNFNDEITFRPSPLEGLGVLSDEYTAVLRRVIIKALPPDLGILFRQRLKETSSLNHDDTAAVTDKSHQVKHLMTSLSIQVEAREERFFDQASSSASQRYHPLNRDPGAEPVLCSGSINRSEAAVHASLPPVQRVGPDCSGMLHVAHFRRKTQEASGAQATAAAVNTTIWIIVKKCKNSSSAAEEHHVCDRFVVDVLDTRLWDQLSRNPKLMLQDALAQAGKIKIPNITINCRTRTRSWAI
ncbi:hypothetical protein HPB49_001161 [Dermacentor silvarum]|uniref:Uncharacterized protein n=1 Tax=Dermacentor silvarum TaxID=543639 RepID=A0ACB8C6M0_DERSI|nr:hypothetical protein HPB49_001161 [Dermacentor silvarum]